MADAAVEGAQAYSVRQESLDRANIAARKTAAYNALANVYGPVAGDPDSAIKMQEYGQREQTNPIAVEQAQANLTGTNLENTGREQTNAFNEQMNPLKITQQTEANREQPLQFQSEQGLRAAQTGLTRASTAHTNVETNAAQFGLQQQKAAADRNAAFGILNSLTDVAQNGGDIGAEFDKYAPAIAQMEGVDQSHIQPLRQMLVQDPVNTINRLQTALMSQGMASGATGKGAGKGGAPVMSPMVQRAQQVHAMQAVHERIADVPNQLDTAMNLIPRMSNIAIIRKANASIPGTPEYQFEQIVKHQVGENIGLTDLQNMRATGFSLGRVTNMEMQASKNAYANMDLGQDPAQLRANAMRMKVTYQRLNENMQSDIDMASRGVPGMTNTRPVSGQQPQQQQQGGQPSPQDIVNELRRRGVVK